MIVRNKRGEPVGFLCGPIDKNITATEARFHYSFLTAVDRPHPPRAKRIRLKESCTAHNRPPGTGLVLPAGTELEYFAHTDVYLAPVEGQAPDGSGGYVPYIPARFAMMSDRIEIIEGPE